MTTRTDETLEPVTIHLYASVGRHGEVLHVGEVDVDPYLPESGFVAAFNAALQAFVDVADKHPKEPRT